MVHPLSGSHSPAVIPWLGPALPWSRVVSRGQPAAEGGTDAPYTWPWRTVRPCSLSEVQLLPGRDVDNCRAVACWLATAVTIHVHLTVALVSVRGHTSRHTGTPENVGVVVQAFFRGVAVSSCISWFDGYIGGAGSLQVPKGEHQRTLVHSSYPALCHAGERASRDSKYQGGASEQQDEAHHLLGFSRPQLRPCRV